MNLYETMQTKIHFG